MTDIVNELQSRQSPAAANFNWNAPIIDEENADWLKTLSWGGLPETGPAFMEYMDWYDLPRTEQREAAEDFIEYPRARHMPKAVRAHLVSLGLID
jgi:hypothetical protein